jgi:hypothetical protein
MRKYRIQRLGYGSILGYFIYFCPNSIVWRNWRTVGQMTLVFIASLCGFPRYANDLKHRSYFWDGPGLSSIE